jgi:NAD(P)-dependent dehydrogenase (short-subunit alcohol dehydrogenase family)
VSTGRLAGAIALVTGAGSGIGRAIALRFAGEGADVAILDVNAAAAEKVAGEVRGRGARVVAVQGDVSVAGDVDRAVVSAVSALGGLTTLVNNAGIVVRSPLDHTLDADWAREIGVDLTGVFLCSRAAVPHLRGVANASIVSIASVAGMRGAVSPAYTAAKGGVIALTRQLAGELAPQGIRVNSISPGFIATPLNAAVRESGLEAALSARIPLQRWGTPDDVAAACVFLAAPEAAYVTGANLVVDGGLSSILDLGDAYRAFDAKRSEPR